MVTRASFDRVRAAFHERTGSWADGPFFVPGHLCAKSPAQMVDVGDPHAFFSALLDSYAGQELPVAGDDEKLIYWWHTRVHATLNGRPGTVLSQIAFLRHLRGLGVTDLVLLPTAAVGRAARKGVNGSPFAVRDPFSLDDSLLEPLLSEVPGLDQYRAFVHCCHLTGMRVSSHVPLATLAVDSPLFACFPELGYWWNAPEGLSLVPEIAGQLADASSTAPAIPEWAKARFTDAPSTVHWDGERLTGQLGQVRVSLANAVPDIVAGDAATYTWSDSSAIRYGEARVPPSMGVRPASQAGLPDAVAVMAATLAFRWAELGEDGTAIDVSPNVPPTVIVAAEKLAANWEDGMLLKLQDVTDGKEAPAAALKALHDAIAGPRPPTKHWLLAEELWTVERPGQPYDVVTGPFAYSVGAAARDPAAATHALVAVVEASRDRRTGTAMCGAAALHDTLPPPPAEGLILTAVAATLPNAIPTLYAGLEHGSSHLTNAEFGFNENPRLADYRRWTGVSGLSLFTAHPHDWTAGDPLVLERYEQLLPALLDIRRSIGPTRVTSVRRLGAASMAFVVHGQRGELDVIVNLDQSRWIKSPVRSGSRTLVIAGRRHRGLALMPVVDFAGAASEEVAPVSAQLNVRLSTASASSETSR